MLVRPRVMTLLIVGLVLASLGCAPRMPDYALRLVLAVTLLVVALRLLSA